MLKFVHISCKARKKCLFRGNGITHYVFAIIAVRISHNTFENYFCLVRNVSVSVSQRVAPMTNDYTL